MEARKFPAAPALDKLFDVNSFLTNEAADFPGQTHMTKSILPSSLAHFFAAACMLLKLRTSTGARPITFAPGRAVAMSTAIRSVFTRFRPTMQAFAPRWTKARTCALHIVPDPPVQKTTVLSGALECQSEYSYCRARYGYKVKSHTEDTMFPDVTDILGLG